MDNRSLMEIAIKAATTAGTILTDYYNEKVQIVDKESSRDIVSEVDKMAENAIIEILKSYDDSISIITEEQGRVYKRDENRFWLIDALDGTVNYVNHIPFFCVSIAYIENNVTQVAAIYSPISDDIYYGGRSVGVFKNQKAIKVKSSSAKESLFSVSFSGKNYDPTKRVDEFILFADVNDNSRGCLRTGSAALNLAYLAEGKFSGCWGKANKFWDIAAGLLLAELAGAKTELNALDSEKHLTSYIACTESAWDFLYNKAKHIIEIK